MRARFLLLLTVLAFDAPFGCAGVECTFNSDCGDHARCVVNRCVRDCASEGKECGLISAEIGLGCLGGTAGAQVSDCSTFGAAGRCFGDTRVWVDQGLCRWATMSVECQSSGK